MASWSCGSFLMLFALTITSCQSSAFGIAWNWLLTNPHGFLGLQRSTPSHHNSKELFSSSRQGDHALPLASLEEKFFRGSDLEHRNLDERDLKPETETLGTIFKDISDTMECFVNYDCGQGFYCDSHYKTCRPLKEEGDVCRLDTECPMGFDCMFGRCLPHVQPGHKGARCDPTNQNSCNAGHCCARKHGEWVCKAKLSLGKYCYVPEGGLTYTLNERCPCEENLACREVSTSGKSSEPDWLQPWNRQRRYRCFAP